MDWIDSFVAVGSMLDAEEVLTLVRKDIDLVIDARLCFTNPPDIQPIPDKVFRMASLLCDLSYIKTYIKGVKVLVHCFWGNDRTPFIAMVYYTIRYGVHYRTAYEHVKEKHPTTVFHWDWVKLLDEWKD